MNGDNKNATISDSSGQIWEILPDENKKPTLSFKLIIIGNQGVGKSCLTMRGIKNKFDENSNSTLGFEYLNFLLKTIDDQIIQLQIWDTSGQEVYRSLITNFYRNSSLAILVYSIDNENSFKDLEIWLKELKLYSNPDAKVFVIGNKIDLEDKRKVEKASGVKFTQNYKLDLFLETSAKTGFNAQNVFIEAARSLYDDYLKYKYKFDEVKSIRSFKNSDIPSVVSRTTIKTYTNKCAC